MERKLLVDENDIISVDLLEVIIEDEFNRNYKVGLNLAYPARRSAGVCYEIGRNKCDLGEVSVNEWLESDYDDVQPVVEDVVLRLREIGYDFPDYFYVDFMD